MGEFSSSKKFSINLSNAGLAGNVARISGNVAGLKPEYSNGAPLVTEPEKEVWRFMMSGFSGSSGSS